MGESFYLGINLSHESSVAVLSKYGEILFAISEERLVRKKNFTGFPRKSIIQAGQFLKDAGSIIVVVGSHSTFPVSEALYFQWIFDEYSRPSFDWISGPFNTPPGYQLRSPWSAVTNPWQLQELVKERILKELNEIGLTVQSVLFEDHHESHILSGFAGSGFSSGLAFSLDAEGDGHSGAVTRFQGNDHGLYSASTLQMFPVESSIGYFYSAVTKRYNFKPGQHEGKITGLAALGKHSEAVNFLRRIIRHREGIIDLGISQNRYIRVLRELIYEFGIINKYHGSFDQLVDKAEKKTQHYEDLAFAAQLILEDVVVALVRSYINRNEESNITLSGGVFANVRLNQKISEMEEVRNLHIFPSMGDAGLAAGGVWRNLLKRSQLYVGPKYSTMYLGSDSENELSKSISLDSVEIRKLSEQLIIQETVQALCEKKVVGLIQGRMEFGPRALMNRSILVDPQEKNINATLNARLKRTEFMPFAPVCREEDLSEIFELPNLEQFNPWNYMTITCQVREKWRTKLAAVTHVDGSARPQVVSKADNAFAHKLLTEYYYATGIPVLVNTSFNVHEEPIVLEVEDGVRSLVDGRIDFLVTPKAIYLRK